MKNTTRKILLALVIVLTMLVGMTAITASAAESDTTVYLTPNGNWKTDNARFAVYCFGNGETWVSMTKVSGENNLYSAVVPAGYPKIIFCRMNPNTTDNNWNNKWNQTEDLVLPTNGTNHYTVTEGTWDKGGGTWSIYGCQYTEVITKQPTCTEEGSKTKTCILCTGDKAHTDIVAIPAKGHTYGNDLICDVCGERATFTVAGGVQNSDTDAGFFSTRWDTNNTANDMIYDETTDSYSKTYTNVAAGTYAFKCVRDHAWGVAYGNPNSGDMDGNYVLTLTETKNVTITLKGETITVTFSNSTGGEQGGNEGGEQGGNEGGEQGGNEGGEATTNVDYYLVGYINGADYGFGEKDWQTIGDYKFVNGKVTVDITETSYVLVKTGDNANWYMFQTFCETTSGTLVNTTTGAAEKMSVPAGKVTFTLVVNADGTLTLSYTVEAGNNTGSDSGSNNTNNNSNNNTNNNQSSQGSQTQEPVEELNFFQKIIKAVTDFFANIGNWFKNLFAKKD